MERKFLEEKGLEKEVIDAIMAEHGKSIHATKADLAAAESQVETLTGQITERDLDIAELKKNSNSDEDLSSKLQTLETKYEDLKTESETKLAQHRKDSAINLALTKAGAKNAKAVTALLDADKLQLNDEGVEGLQEQIEALQETDAYLFQSAKEEGPNIQAGGDPNGDPGNEVDAFEEAANKYI